MAISMSSTTTTTTTTTNLRWAVQTALREAVGDNIWNQAMIYYTYHRVQRIKQGKLVLRGKTGTVGTIAFPVEVSEFLFNHDDHSVCGNHATTALAATNGIKTMGPFNHSNVQYQRNNNIIFNNLNTCHSSDGTYCYDEMTTDTVGQEDGFNIVPV
jgi:hypothetical protein